MGSRWDASRSDPFRTSIMTRSTAPWEPPLRPGVPNPSIPGEAFLDTPMVNGTAYPFLEVELKAYRFRVLNAANDRMFNLQLYVAADKTIRPHRHRPVPRHSAPCSATVSSAGCQLHRGQDGPGQCGSGEPICGLRRAAFPIRQRKDRTGGRSAPKAASCRSRLWYPSSPSAGTSTRLSSISASSISTRFSWDQRSGRM